jgi:hypothetical protein
MSETTMPLGGPVRFIVDECLACQRLTKRVEALEARLAADAHARRDHEAEYARNVSARLAASPSRPTEAAPQEGT